MSGIAVIGLGAVSPAGWSVADLRRSLVDGNLPPPEQVEVPGCGQLVAVRRVPKPPERPPSLAHPRLRRTSPISHFAVAAASEALADAARDGVAPKRIGIILCTMCGCVTYTQRFFGEVLRDPATASPLLFPETVFNAPASHIATVLESPSINYTLVGDSGVFLHGLATAAQWLEADRVDACVVAACEETDWITADALRHFTRPLVPSEGAGAMVLARETTGARRVSIENITRPQTFTNAPRKRLAMQSVAKQLHSTGRDQLLCAGFTGIRRVDEAESGAWNDWPGARCDLKPRLGEAFTAGAAWQCIAAVDAVREGRYARAVVSVPGAHREAIGAAFAASGRSSE